MKRLFLRLRSLAFLRPVFYKAVARIAVGLTAALLWDRFINSGAHVNMYDRAFFVIGVLFAGLAWFSYLRLDGIKAPRFFKKLPKKAPKRRGGDIADFVDEELESRGELEGDDLVLCAMAADLVCAVLFILPAVAMAFRH